MYSFYYSLTTLATIGYGDLIPTNSTERIIAIFIMLVGVAMYSYVMGSFTELLANYDRNMGNQDKSPDLQNWIVLLGHFSHKRNFPNNLLKNIEFHFEDYWKNSRNHLISKQDPYFIGLPKSIKYKIIDYLWNDVLKQFKNFFIYTEENIDKYKGFYYDISFFLMPRM